MEEDKNYEKDVFYAMVALAVCYVNTDKKSLNVTLFQQELGVDYLYAGMILNALVTNNWLSGPPLRFTSNFTIVNADRHKVLLVSKDISKEFVNRNNGTIKKCLARMSNGTL